MIKDSIFIDEIAWLDCWHKRIKEKKKKKQCVRCLYDEDIPSISFDEKGICNYCKIHNELCKKFPRGDDGWTTLQEIANKIKRENKKSKYDVIVGVSGGCDSSYMLHISKKLGLRPLAVHYDNTWNTKISEENLNNLIKKLDVDLWKYTVNDKEYDDLYYSFLKAGVPDLEAPSDIGLATTLYMAADKFNVKYIFEGHSFRTEGISPLGWLYMDAKYINNVQKEFGTKKLKTFPNLWLSSWLKWMIIKKIKKIRPLWYIEHNKEETKKMLSEKYNWQWYGGHHLENKITAFYQTYFIPRRFGFDYRYNNLSALIRSGQISRLDGLKQLYEPPKSDPEIVELFKKRLGLSNEKFIELMTLPKKNYRDYETYKPTFERWRPFFYLMAKAELIPWSFYIKYTSKDEI